MGESVARLLCLHETGTSGAVWAPLASALPGGMELTAPDRLGWAPGELPEDYRATTLEEQAELAAALLAGAGEPSLVVGAGLGAAVALALLLAHPDEVAGAILIEPPLLAFVPAATEAISADRVALGEAVEEGGLQPGVDLYLSGGMPGLGPGVERLPAELTAPAASHPRSLFAELGAVAAWNLPFAALRTVSAPSRLVISSGTPAFLRDAIGPLAERLAGSEVVELPGTGPAHSDAAAEIAGLAAGLSAV
jgi:pimeloyl-ACP methyl ester carboxylesterase